MTKSPQRVRVGGFTLLELVATLVIVGILGAVSIPRMFDDEDFAQRGYVDELASSLRYAQRIAIASGCGVAVTIDAASYSAVQRNFGTTCDGDWDTPVLRADGSPLAGTAPSDVYVSQPARLEFQSNGMLDGDAAAFNVAHFALTVDQGGNVSVYP